jgi:flagellar operon protein
METARVGISAAPRPAPPPLRPAAGRESFAEALREASGGLQLSRHAQKRVERRELDLDAARQERLSAAIASAALKGARQSVVVLDDLAVVVNVRDRTVVTAMSTEGGRQRVFTNVDSVVIA